MTNEVLFVLSLGLFYTVLLTWGFMVLPGERWQVLASVPSYKTGGGNWKGLNLTFYGFFIACSYTLATAVMFVLFGAELVPIRAIVIVFAMMGLVCIPASRWIAAVVEKKSHTLTVGGAAFVGTIAAPWAVWLANGLFGRLMQFDLNVATALATFAIAYAFGEGTGRLACISFGCCYGKPLDQCRPLVRRLFRRFHFVFMGKTKKIAYASGLDGEPVIPVQAITSVIYITAALAGVWLFLANRPVAAFLVTAGVTQVWRFLSEFLRADHRGAGQLSAYQWMSLISLGYVLACGAVLPGPSGQMTPDIAQGLTAIWVPAVLLFLQLVWAGMFLLTGRSAVTGSVISLHVVEDRT